MRLGTRASALASVQARTVAEWLRAGGASVEMVPVSTEGDRSTQPLTQIGGTGVFASALRSALLRGEIDLAVHSLKDLPVADHPGLTLAAIPVREDPRDVVITASGETLAQLPFGARVGTGSPRRAGQLTACHPHLRIQDIRGNVDTRIAKVANGEVDAVVLAKAGVNRLGRTHEVSHVLELEEMLPAPGQGALAVECRDPHPSEQASEHDRAVHSACAVLDDVVTRACVGAERAMLARLEAGCTAPVGAVCTPTDEGFLLRGWAELDGVVSEGRAVGPDPESLGRRLADTLLHQIQTEPTAPILVTERES
ncbi:MAG: hydroxymethylbilane synthase [Ornithinimicrobium sp.]